MRPANIKSISYQPSMVPADISNIDVLRRYLREEFELIAMIITQLAAGHLSPTYVEPAKPRPGDVRYAAGAPYWDPGSGEGIYFMNQASLWVQVG